LRLDEWQKYIESEFVEIDESAKAESLDSAHDRAPRAAAKDGIETAAPPGPDPPAEHAHKEIDTPVTGRTPRRGSRPKRNAAAARAGAADGGDALRDTAITPTAKAAEGPASLAHDVAPSTRSGPYAGATKPDESAAPADDVAAVAAGEADLADAAAALNSQPPPVAAGSDAAAQPYATLESSGPVISRNRVDVAGRSAVTADAEVPAFERYITQSEAVISDPSGNEGGPDTTDGRAAAPSAPIGPVAGERPEPDRSMQAAPDPPVSADLGSGAEDREPTAGPGPDATSDVSGATNHEPRATSHRPQTAVVLDRYPLAASQQTLLQLRLVEAGQSTREQQGARHRRAALLRRICDPALTLDEASLLLDLTEDAVHELAAAGRLPMVEPSSRQAQSSRRGQPAAGQPLIRLSDIVAYLAMRRARA